MKKAILFGLPLASAEWGTWITGSYCDIEQLVLGEIYSENPEYNEDYCADFCRQVLNEKIYDANGGYYNGNGKNYCCDFEAWSDNTFNCYLYEGTEVTEQDMNEYP